MIAKNNIFNIRAGRAQWLGMTGTRKGFVEFDSQEHGIRAWLVLMRSYLRRNRQLGRETMPFDRDIKSRLEQVLSKLLVEYGAGKD